MQHSGIALITTVLITLFTPYRAPIQPADGTDLVVAKRPVIGVINTPPDAGVGEYTDTLMFDNSVGSFMMQTYRSADGVTEQIQFLFTITDGTPNDGDQILIHFDADHGHGSNAVDRAVLILRQVGPNNVTVGGLNPGGNPASPVPLPAAQWSINGAAPGGWTAEVKLNAADLGLSSIPDLMGMYIRVTNVPNAGATTFGNYPNGVNAFGFAAWANLKTRFPIDYLVVLDHSGSMLSQQKWINAKAATNFFVNTMSILGEQAHFNDRVGLVLFRWICSGANQTAVTKPLASVGAFPVGAYTDAPPAATDPLSNFCTPIGEGLSTAFTTLTANSAAEVVERQRGVLLLSDGLQNRPASSFLPAATGYDPCPAQAVWNACPPGTLSNVPVNTVAFGEGDWQVDTDLLSDIVGRYVGAFDATYNLSTNPEDLKESFIDGLEHFYNTNLIYSGVVPASFPVESGNDKLIAIASWSAAGVENIALQRDDGGFVNVPCNPPAASSPVGFAICAVKMPASGTWRVVAADGTFNTPPSRLFVVADLQLRAQFRVEPVQPETGDPLLLTVALRDAGQPVLSDAAHPVQVTVQIQTPEQGVGTFASTHEPETCKEVRPTLPGAEPRGARTFGAAVTQPTGAAQANDPQSPLFSLMSQLLNACNLTGLPRGQEALAMRDDGTQGDAVANDGIYSLRYTGADIEGTYVFRFNVTGTTAAGESFARTKRQATYVRVHVDAQSTISGSHIVQQSGNIIIREFYILPRGGIEYLGPGKAHKVDFIKSAGPGTFVGEVIDYGNGFYARRLQYDRTQGEPTVTPQVYGQPLRPAGGGRNAFELGIHAAFTRFDDSFDFDDSPGVGAHFGVRLFTTFVVEVEGDATFVEEDALAVSIDGRVYTLFGNVRYDFGSGNLVPFAKVGVGKVWFRDFATDDDATATQAALGASWWLSAALGVRAQLRAMRFEDVLGAGGTTDHYRGTVGVVLRF